MQMTRHIATRHAGLKGDGPAARARVLHQQRLAKGLARGREHGIADLLHTAVDGLHEGNAPEDALPQIEQLLPQDVRRQHAGDEHNADGQQHTQPGNVVRRLHLRRQQIHALVHRADDQMQHPQRDGQRNPDQQTGDDVFLEGAASHGIRHLGGVVRSG